MSQRHGVPDLTQVSAYLEDDFHFTVPELHIQPPTPRSPRQTSEAIDVSWITKTRSLSISYIPTMHGSRPAPSASLLDTLNPPLSRDRRSQSVPLSLDAVVLSKKIVNVSDRFEARHQAVKMQLKERSRTLSGSEISHGPSYKRHSDLIEEWLTKSDDFSPKIGSPV